MVFNRVLHQTSARSFLQKQSIVHKKCLISYFSLHRDLCNQVYSGFHNWVINLFCIINFLISNSGRMLLIRNWLGILENHEIISLQKDAISLLRIHGISKKKKPPTLGSFPRYWFEIGRLFCQQSSPVVETAHGSRFQLLRLRDAGLVTRTLGTVRNRELRESPKLDVFFGRPRNSTHTLHLSNVTSFGVFRSWPAAF